MAETLDTGDIEDLHTIFEGLPDTLKDLSNFCSERPEVISNYIFEKEPKLIDALVSHAWPSGSSPGPNGVPRALSFLRVTVEIINAVGASVCREPFHLWHTCGAQLQYVTSVDAFPNVGKVAVPTVKKAKEQAAKLISTGSQMVTVLNEISKHWLRSARDWMTEKPVEALGDPTKHLEQFLTKVTLKITGLLQWGMKMIDEQDTVMVEGADGGTLFACASKFQPYALDGLEKIFRNTPRSILKNVDLSPLITFFFAEFFDSFQYDVKQAVYALQMLHSLLAISPSAKEEIIKEVTLKKLVGLIVNHQSGSNTHAFSMGSRSKDVPSLTASILLGLIREKAVIDTLQSNLSGDVMQGLHRELLISLIFVVTHKLRSARCLFSGAMSGAVLELDHMSTKPLLMPYRCLSFPQLWLGAGGFHPVSALQFIFQTEHDANVVISVDDPLSHLSKTTSAEAPKRPGLSVGVWQYPSYGVEIPLDNMEKVVGPLPKSATYGAKAVGLSVLCFHAEARVPYVCIPFLLQNAPTIRVTVTFGCSHAFTVHRVDTETFVLPGQEDILEESSPDSSVNERQKEQLPTLNCPLSDEGNEFLTPEELCSVAKVSNDEKTGDDLTKHQESLEVIVEDVKRLIRQEEARPKEEEEELQRRSDAADKLVQLQQKNCFEVESNARQALGKQQLTEYDVIMEQHIQEAIAFSVELIERMIVSCQDKEEKLRTSDLVECEEAAWKELMEAEKLGAEEAMRVALERPFHELRQEETVVRPNFHVEEWEALEEVVRQCRHNDLEELRRKELRVLADAAWMRSKELETIRLHYEALRDKLQVEEAAARSSSLTVPSLEDEEAKVRFLLKEDERKQFAISVRMTLERLEREITELTGPIEDNGRNAITEEEEKDRDQLIREKRKDKMESRRAERERLIREEAERKAAEEAEIRAQLRVHKAEKRVNELAARSALDGDAVLQYNAIRVDLVGTVDLERNTSEVLRLRAMELKRLETQAWESGQVPLAKSIRSWRTDMLEGILDLRETVSHQVNHKRNIMIAKTGEESYAHRNFPTFKPGGSLSNNNPLGLFSATTSLTPPPFSALAPLSPRRSESPTATTRLVQPPLHFSNLMPTFKGKNLLSSPRGENEGATTSGLTSSTPPPAPLLSSSATFSHLKPLAISQQFDANGREKRAEQMVHDLSMARAKHNIIEIMAEKAKMTEQAKLHAETTRLLTLRAEELKYLENEAKIAGKTSLMRSIQRWRTDMLEGVLQLNHTFDETLTKKLAPLPPPLRLVSPPKKEHLKNTPRQSLTNKKATFSSPVSGTYPSAKAKRHNLPPLESPLPMEVASPVRETTALKLLEGE